MLVHVHQHPLGDPVVENGSDEGNGDSLRHNRRVKEASEDEVEEVRKVVLDVDDRALVELVCLSLRQRAGVSLGSLPAASALLNNDNVVEQGDDRVRSKEDEDHLHIIDEVSTDVPSISILVYNEVTDR